MARKLITAESVTEGHPDKLADRISDAVLDAVLAQDPYGRVACETFVMQGLIVVGGEVTTTACFDPGRIARRVLADVGYVKPEYGIAPDACAVANLIRQQSPDIAQAVLRSQEAKAGSTDPKDVLGAGDQGIMFGYATTETPERMPLPIVLAHKLAKRLAQVRKEGSLPYLRPDGKTQVTVEYENGKPIRVHTVLLAAQHAEDVELEQLREDLKRYVVEPVLDGWMDEETQVFVNTSGRFVIGGPASDTGMTGRKIIADTYGGYGSHGAAPLREGPDEGGPLRLVLRAVRGGEPRGRGPGGGMRDPGGLRHREGPAFGPQRGDLRDGEGFSFGLTASGGGAL